MSAIQNLTPRQRYDLGNKCLDALVEVLERFGVPGSVTGQYDLYGVVLDEIEKTGEVLQ